MVHPERRAVLIVRVTSRGRHSPDIVVSSSPDVAAQHMTRVRLTRLEDVAIVVRTWLSDHIDPDPGSCADGDATLTPPAHIEHDEGRTP
jgi:hypothetical protein